jgi:hypothetical protein
MVFAGMSEKRSAPWGSQTGPSVNICPFETSSTSPSTTSSIDRGGGGSPPVVVPVVVSSPVVSAVVEPVALPPVVLPPVDASVVVSALVAVSPVVVVASPVVPAVVDDALSLLLAPSSPAQAPAVRRRTLRRAVARRVELITPSYPDRAFSSTLASASTATVASTG